MKSYSTINHPYCFDKLNGKTSILSNKNSINNCIGLLLTTSKGELLGDPGYGCRLLEYIHEPNDFVLQDILREEIVDSVSKYESRVYITEEDINVVSELNLVSIYINYYVKSSGEIGEFNFSLLREDYNE